MIPYICLHVSNTGKVASHIFQDNKLLKDSEICFAKLSGAHRHLAPQDAGGYGDSTPLKNMGAMASDIRIPSSRAHSSR